MGGRSAAWLIGVAALVGCSSSRTVTYGVGGGERVCCTAELVEPGREEGSVFRMRCLKADFQKLENLHSHCTCSERCYCTSIASMIRGRHEQEIRDRQKLDPEAARRMTPVRRAVEQALRANHDGLASLYPVADEALREMVEIMRTEQGEWKLERVLFLYASLVSLRGAPETPEPVRRLAREGSASIRKWALEAAAHIADEKGLGVLIEALRAGPGTTAESYQLFVRTVEVSRYSGSTRVAAALNDHLTARLPETPLSKVLEALAHIGRGADIGKVQELASRPGGALVRPGTWLVLEANRVLSSPDLPVALLERLRSKWMSGTFSWYDWALDQILWLNYRQLAGPLRNFYEENKHHYQPLGSHRWGMKLLHAIHRLGGEVTPEEEEALRSTGRIP